VGRCLTPQAPAQALLRYRRRHYLLVCTLGSEHTAFEPLHEPQDGSCHWFVLQLPGYGAQGWRRRRACAGVLRAWHACAEHP
jgi:hypothetical protein